MAECVDALGLSPGELIRSSESSMVTAADLPDLNLNQTNHSVALQHYQWKRKWRTSGSCKIKYHDRESPWMRMARS